MEKILVTGCRRTGTTFLGRMLSINDKISYIHEPFNYESGIKGLSIKYWYPYYTKNNITARDYNIISNLCNLNKINSKVSLGDGKTKAFKHDVSRTELFKNILTNFSNESFKKRFIRFFLKNRFYYSYLKSKINLNRKKIIFKDPIASLSSKYLVDHFNFRVIIIIRHPAAYYYSMKKQNWGIEPYNFLNQNTLVNYFSNELIDNLKKIKTRQEFSLYEYIIVYKFLLKYLKNDPNNFIIVKHEELSERPVYVLKKLYKKFGIPFTEEIYKKIRKYTNQSNSTKDEKVSDIKRNSSELISEWKNNLSKKEINFVKIKTFELVSEFYNEDNWVL